MLLRTVLLTALAAVSATAAPRNATGSPALDKLGVAKRADIKHGRCSLHIDDYRASELEAQTNDDRKAELRFKDADRNEFFHLPQTDNRLGKEALPIDIGLEHDIVLGVGPDTEWR